MGTPEPLVTICHGGGTFLVQGGTFHQNNPKPFVSNGLLMFYRCSEVFHMRECSSSGGTDLDALRTLDVERVERMQKKERRGFGPRG